MIAWEWLLLIPVAFFAGGWIALDILERALRRDGLLPDESCEGRES